MSSGQVENAIFSHRDVIDCAVVALPEAQLGERVAAVCIVKERAKMPSKEEIVAAAAKTLPKVCALIDAVTLPVVANEDIISLPL